VNSPTTGHQAKQRRRLHSQISIASLVVALVATNASGCAEAMTDRPDSGLQKNRPTEGGGAVFSGYRDAATQFLDSDSGAIRVWYATEGEHSPDPTDDAPADGIPDIVQAMADTGDEVATSLAERGWRRPIADTLSGTSTDDGGSDAFDIYLVNFQRADGLFFAEGCLPGGLPRQCTGYIAIKSDFRRTGYASMQEAVTVLVSHEYFHAVQAAYSDDLPGWWSEGTATWHEEFFDPTQDDYERLADSYFAEAGRSLNGIVQGTTDAFAYGTGVYVRFIEQTLGEGVLLEVFERLATGEELEDALLTSVASHTPFSESFAEFAAWSLCTGSRTLDGFGFPEAASLDELPTQALDGSASVNWDVEVRKWAFEPAELSRPQALSLRVSELDGWQSPPTLVVVDPLTPGEWSLLRAGDTLRIEASDAPLWIALVNSDSTDRTAGRVEIRVPPAEVATPDETPDADCPAGDNCGSEGSDDDEDRTPGADDGSGCSAGTRPETDSPWLWLILASAIIRRKTRGRMTVC
jgi:hypothetical protein